MSSPWMYENIWVDKSMYDEAERKYYSALAKKPLTPLADEVGKFRRRLNEIKGNFNKTVAPTNNEQMKNLDKRVYVLETVLDTLNKSLEIIDDRILRLEKCFHKSETAPVNLQNVTEVKIETDNDVDLFASDSEEDEAAAKIREERLAAYHEKKSKKPALIAKSNIIFDVKPWDDETDMKAMEEHVRKIEMDGLLWGSAKLVPLAYGIHKLQISCVIEDDKVSVDLLQEEITNLEDYVQSVDIAAFNKV